jgi:phage terminase large subunit
LSQPVSPARLQPRRRAERLLVVLDEASGVSEAVWESAETLITSPRSRLLAIGNPTRTSGAFYRAFMSERARALAVGLDWSKVPTWQSD